MLLAVFPQFQTDKARITGLVHNFEALLKHVHMKPGKITTTNEAILDGIRQHSTPVLKAVFEECLPVVKRFVIKNSGTAEDAEDVFMDALEVVYQKVKKGELNLTCAFCSYLFAICKNLWLKKLHKRKLENRVILNEWEESILGEEPTVEMEEMERMVFFRERICLLEKDCQRVLYLSLVEDLSMENIAKEMGYSSAGYARKKKSICKKKLKELIRGDSRYDEFK